MPNLASLWVYLWCITPLGVAHNDNSENLAILGYEPGPPTHKYACQLFDKSP